MKRRITTTFTLHVVEEFADEDPPSLSGMPVYTTDGEEVTQTRGPGLAKCGPVRDERKKAGGGK